MASSSCASGAVPQRPQKRAKLDGGMRIMEEIRALGYIPKQYGEHQQLAQNYQRAVKNGRISQSQKQEAEALTAAHDEAKKSDGSKKIMEQIRALGYIPKRNSGHDKLVQNYQNAVENGKISPLEQQEAEALTAAHQASLAQKLGFAT